LKDCECHADVLEFAFKCIIVPDIRLYQNRNKRFVKAHVEAPGHNKSTVVNAWKLTHLPNLAAIYTPVLLKL